MASKSNSRSSCSGLGPSAMETSYCATRRRREEQHLRAMKPAGRRLAALFVVVVVSASLSCATQHTDANAPGSFAERLANVDAKLAALHPVLTGFPPAVSSDRERRAVEQQWSDAEIELKGLARTAPDDPSIQFRLGVLYRYGHNLDIPDAANRCISHLQRTIELRPDYADAYLELGIFYTDSELSWAPLGEANLKKAIQLSGSAPIPRAWRALSFAYYYLGRFSDSVAAAEYYLKLVPEDEDMKKIMEIAEEKAAQISPGSDL